VPDQLTHYRVFIASPGGLGDERKAFREALRQYNEEDAVHRGIYFQPVGWELTLGGVGRPQARINEDVRACDLFVLVLWDRWGSSPFPDDQEGDYSSGTEEEYHVALGCYEDDARPMRRLLLMFKGVNDKQLSDPGPQLQRVLDFRKQIEREKTHLYHTFDTPDRLKEILRRHLAAWVRHHENGWPEDAPDAVPTDAERVAPPGDEMPSDEDTQEVETNPLVAKARRLADEGRLTEAETAFARATAGRQDPDALIDYASFLRRIGRLEQAEALLEAAREVADERNDDKASAKALRGLGNVFLSRGELAEAEAMHRKALEIDEALGYRQGMAANYGNLGNVFGARGELAEAEAMHRKSLEIEEALGRKEGMAADYGNLGNVFRARGELYQIPRITLQLHS
jgi:tetratricopeptide (TPR) repeat protein